MGSDLRMGLDPRDCRCDAAMILGDSAIPDDVHWRIQDRDKTCVWLDFIDGQFDSLVDSEVNGVENRKASVNVELAEIAITRMMTDDVQSDKVYSAETSPIKAEDKSSEARITLTETSAIRDNRTVSVYVPTKRTSVISIDSSTVEIRGD